MKKLTCFLYLVLFIACSPVRHIVINETESLADTHIEAVTKQFVPDKRTAIFNVQRAGTVLIGETNLPSAKEALVKRLETENIPYLDSIILLPASELENNIFGVVTISVANFRTGPKHGAELATQATLGTPLKVLKKEKGWYLVQTPDRYISWLDAGGLQLMDSLVYNNWLHAEKIIYTAPYGFAYSTPEKSQTVSDMVAGAILPVTGEVKEHYPVVFPDGRRAFVLANEATPLKDWTISRNPTPQNLVETSKHLMGLPYLWGGTSFKGVDCSGFTKTVFFLNGLVLPRDASQQVHIGHEINTKNNWNELQAGDLLFFGSPAENGRPERVVHVGMWIGNNEFIHASGRVRISSFDPNAANFDEYELKRFLRAKRVTAAEALIDLRKPSAW